MGGSFAVMLYSSSCHNRASSYMKWYWSCSSLSWTTSADWLGTFQSLRSQALFSGTDIYYTCVCVCVCVCEKKKKKGTSS